MTSETDRIRAVCRFIVENGDRRLTLDDLCARAGMSRFHFARRFKALVGVTAHQYAAGLRLHRFKGELRAGKDIDAALYDAGYGSPSRVYENAASRLGMTPAQYRRAGEGVEISYAALPTPLGVLMIGATDRGVCFVRFGDTETEVLEQLRAEYSKARIVAMAKPHHPQFARWVEAIDRYIGGENLPLDLPLDLRGTAFQMRVWRYLQSIPYGDVQTYGEVAAGIGDRQAVRAVASACARNPAAIVVPCHRVIRASGELGGYRWGIERKRALIDGERSVVTAPRAQ